MKLFWGLVGAGLAALASWAALVPVTANLPDNVRWITLVGVAAIWITVAFLGGTTIARRASAGGNYPRQFMTATLIVIGALLAGSAVAAVTLAYLVAFGAWPVTLLGTILYVLAAPVLAVSGAIIGGLVGLLCALIVGTVLRVLSPAWR